MYPGGDTKKWVYVAITTVPMGWVGAVDLIQHFARRLVFNIAEVPRASEVSSAGLFGWSGRPLHPFAELDGAHGILRHARDKGQSLVFTILSLLGRAQWSAPALQHCVGLCTFAAGFRRPLFSIFQEVYSEILERDPKEAFVPRSASVVELLIAVLLIPLAGVNLRTPLRHT